MGEGGGKWTYEHFSEDTEAELNWFKVMEIYICSIVLNDLQLLEGRTHVVINWFILAPPTSNSASYSTFVGNGGPLLY